MEPKTPAVPAPRRAAKGAEKEEKDNGFNASHGYGVGHGGPSGPGDVPGDKTPQGPAKVVPAPADDEKDP